MNVVGTTPMWMYQLRNGVKITNGEKDNRPDWNVQVE
jgi:hypothetical protein